MTKLRPLTESPRYEDFVKSRDIELERILAKYLTAFDRIVSGLQTHAEFTARGLSTAGSDHYNAKKTRDQFASRLEPWFDIAIHRSADLVTQLRKTTYVLSYIGQAEAIGRATALKTTFHLDKKSILDGTADEMTHGGTPLQRMGLAFTRLKTDIIDAFHMSQVMGSDLADTLARINRAFPAKMKRKRISKLIAPMREARVSLSTFREGFSFGVIDPEEWDALLDDYLSDQIPFGRAPEDKIFLGGKTPEGEADFVYQWQVEQEVTDDFVNSVRNGEIDAANENGIDDFQWIAIIDKVTDECCECRDGHTSSEIEAMIESGEIDADECDATVAPGHFRCRCRNAPMSKDMPDVAPPDFGSFDDWMSEKAQAA